MTIYNPLTGLLLAVIIVPRVLAADLQQVPVQKRPKGEDNNEALSTANLLHFSIPVQPLDEALNDFIEVTDWQIGFSAPLTQGINAKAVIGRYSPRQALKLLLKDSGLTYQITRDGIVIILPTNDNSPVSPMTEIEPTVITQAHPVARLKKITVMGKAQLRDDLNSYRVSHTSSATKTDTPVREIPQSIQVINRTLMDDQQSVTITESLRNVSGVVPNHPLLAPDFERTLIRGFPAEQLLDGFSQYYNPGDRESTVNVARIEVLKGPSALLYSGGYGSPPGGLVNVISKRPESQLFSEIGIKFGSHYFYQPFFDLNLPVNDNILFRLTGEYTNSESHIDVLETERYNINPALTITNNDSTTLTLQGKLSQWQQQDYQGLPATGTVAGNFIIAPETYIGPQDIEPSNAEFQGAWGTLDHNFNDIWSLNFKARYTQSKFNQKVQNIFGADGRQADQPFFRPSTWLLANIELFQEQMEMSFVFNTLAKFSIGPTENTVLMGADYSEIDDQGYIDLDMTAIGTVDLAAPKFPVPYTFPGSRVNNIFIKNTTYGGYAQLQSTIYDRLHLLFGMRLGNVTNDYENKVPGFEFSLQTSKTEWLPRFGIVFDVSDEFSLFASYSRGMRGHLFNNFRTAPIPELSEQMEAGIKFEIAEQLTGQFATYKIERSNVLATDNNSSFPSSVAEGEQRSSGFEFDLLWQASDELSFLAAYAYTKAKFTNDRAGVPSGTPLPGVPEHSGRLWANFRFQQAPLNGLNIGAGIYAQSGVFLSKAHLFTTDSYYTLDATIDYQFDQFRLGLSVKNLTDEDYFERLGFFESRVGPGPGTSIFATTSMRF